jgi:hypothetical protein
MIDDESPDRFDFAREVEVLTPDEVRAIARDLLPTDPTGLHIALYIGMSAILKRSRISSEEERRAKLQAWCKGLGFDEAEAFRIVDGFLRECGRGPSQGVR